MRCALLAAAGLLSVTLAWAQPAGDGRWTMAAGDYASTRFSPLDQIDAGVAWLGTLR